MKNKNKPTHPGAQRGPRNNDIRQTRETPRFMPKAPHHDLLVLSFYPGMGAAGTPVDHSTAA